MSLLRRLDTHHKLYASVMLLLAMGVGLALWLLGQLEQMSSFTAGGGQKLAAAAAYLHARQVAANAIALSVALAALLAWWLGAELQRPVHEAALMARRLAEGDLSQHAALAVPGEAGELLTSMDQINDKLAAMIVRLRAGTHSLADHAGQLACGGMALAAGGGEQAGALAQGAAALAQLAGALRLTAAQAQPACALAGAQAVQLAAAVAAFDACAAQLAGPGACAPPSARQEAQQALAAAGHSLHTALAGARSVHGAVAELALACAQHSAGLGQQQRALAGLALSSREHVTALANAAAAAAAMRDEAGGLSRATAAFVLDPAYGVQPPRLQLVASNPRPARAAWTGAGRARPAAIHAVDPMTGSGP